jgi:hypothetical protein
MASPVEGLVASAQREAAIAQEVPQHLTPVSAASSFTRNAACSVQLEAQ